MQFGVARDGGRVGVGKVCAGWKMGCYVWVGGDIKAWGDDDRDANGEGGWEEGGENERTERDWSGHYILRVVVS